mmetsp:Transcript_26037/g.52607  ORF Transcript_26037/g.52607 Transcript_26037/m.52607 type:complete len:113 (-) Transcript_26037:108-446(-)
MQFVYTYSHSSLYDYDHGLLTTSLKAVGGFEVESSESLRTLVKLTGQATSENVFYDKPYTHENAADEIHKSKDSFPCQFRVTVGGPLPFGAAAPVDESTLEDHQLSADAAGP